MKKPKQTYVILEGECAGPKVCPLSRVQAGQVVCIKRLAGAPDTAARLRELGFCEEQRIKLLAGKPTFICQVCDARFGICAELAESILVEPLSPAT